MIGIEHAAISTGVASLGGLVYLVGAFGVGIAEAPINPWAGIAGGAGLSAILCYVIYLREKAAQRSEQRWEKQHQAMMELLAKSIKKNGSDDG